MSTLIAASRAECRHCGVLIAEHLWDSFHVLTQHHGYMTVRGPISGECRRCGKPFMFGLKQDVRVDMTR